jgi:hypothetical protein
MDTTAIVGITLAVIFGLITTVALIVTLNSLRRKRPTWAVRGSTLIRLGQPTLPNLKILYGDQQVQSVTVSRILFWNRGTEPILRENIPPDAPLTIRARDEVQLLNVEVLQDTSGSGLFHHTEDAARQVSTLDFAYLEPNQGAVLQVVHTGTSPEDVSVSGHVIGAGDPVQRRVRVNRYRFLPTSAEFDRQLSPQAKWRIAFWLSLGLFVLLLGLGAVIVLLTYLLPVAREPATTTPLQVLGSVVVAIGIAGIVYASFEYLGTRVPPGLEMYEDDRQMITPPQGDR